VLKSRRGLLAAGLAVAVVGAIGAASILNAGAEQVPGGATKPVAETASPTPPALLPWGARPQKIKRGRAGASSGTLRAGGFTAAPDDTSGSTQPRGRYAPKGNDNPDIKPPQPPGPGQPSDDPAIPGAPAPSESDGAQPNDPPVLPNATGTTESVTDPSGPPATLPATTDPTASASSSDGNVAPEPVPSLSSGSGDPTFSYAGALQDAVTTGFYANLTIAKPTLSTRDYHTLAEIALQSTDLRQTVEIGWNVDRSVNGDSDPHLFVYHWVNGQSTCYNGCGFVQYSSTVKPGDTLAYGVGKKFSIQYSGAAWWVAFDTEWIGYFPESLWINAGLSSFATSGVVKLFGEVASPASTAPCGTQMGNGVDSASTTATPATFGSTTFLNGPAVGLATTAETLNTTTYTVTLLGTPPRTFKYGGTASAC
jgi:hypothetical protein